MAEIAKLLYCLIEKSTEWNWTKSDYWSLTIIKNLKEVLLTAPVLTIYKSRCDASQYGLGAVLSHIYPDKSEIPVAYASRTLNSNWIIHK